MSVGKITLDHVGRRLQYVRFAYSVFDGARIMHNVHSFDCDGFGFPVSFQAEPSRQMHLRPTHRPTAKPKL